MKKIYLLAFILLSTTLGMNAQIVDSDFESYNLGNMADQDPTVWSNWTGDPAGALAENITVVDILASSGFQSGLIAGGGTQDVMLLFGNQTSGEYEFTVNMYIPATKGGYFNIQGETTATGGAGGGGAGVFNSSNIYFNQDGAVPGTFFDQTTGESASYPEATWFELKITFNLDAAGGPTYQMAIDGTDVNVAPVLFQGDATLGGLDLFSIDANNELYVDDALLTDLLSVDDFATKGFSAFPNPVNDVLNLKANENITSVSIFNVLGQQVYQANIDATSSQIDMSQYTSGAYFVKVNIGGTEGTVKVIR